MILKHVNWLCLALCVGAFALAAYLYPQIPAPAPTHWNATGVFSVYRYKAWGVFYIPGLTLILWLTLAVLPRMAPRGYRLDTFMGAYAAIQLAIVALLFAVNLITLLFREGEPVDLRRVLPLCMGLLLIIMGNYMGKLQKNFFVGIRTPWTLANDEVWLRTHRLGGWVMAAAGLAIAVSSALGTPRWLFIALLAATVVIPVAYSYFLYRKLVGFGPNGED